MKNRKLLTALFMLMLPFVLSAQCVQGDCKNGYGVFNYDSGATYRGYYKNGMIDGQGILEFSNGDKYMGYWEQNYRTGTGRLTYSNGNIYEGTFQRNRLEEGTMTYHNGDVYIGTFENDVPSGKGKFVFSNDDWYEGNFQNEQFDGQGTMRYADGSKYIGNWKRGVKHGKGTFYSTDNASVEEEWNMGQLQSGNSAFDNTTVATTNMEEKNLRDCTTQYCASGKGIFKYADGGRYVGQFQNGEPKGKGVCYYANGDRYEGEWANHAPHGEGIMYYVSGRVMGAQWQHGAPIGDIYAEDETISNNIDVIASDEVKIWAVVVGIGRYEYLPSLKFTDDDAYQVYAFLKSPEGGALPDNQIKVLIDEDATKDNVLQTMRQFWLQADENDVVLFYYSGHGLPGAFLPIDYDGYNNRLSHTEIRTLLEKSRAKHKIVLADACHAGSLNEQTGEYSYMAMKRPNIGDQLRTYYSAFEQTKGGTALLLSSKSEEYSLEDSGLRSGIFSHYLIRGLKGEADVDGNKLVNIQEIFSYVHREVKKYTAGAQTPELFGSYDRKMPVSVLR